jgi:hypothetical protein
VPNGGAPAERMTPAQRELFARAGAQLRRCFEGQVAASEQEGAYFVAIGQGGVRVNVAALGEASAMLDACVWIGRGLTASAELGLYLARRNAELPIGSLCIDDDGQIFLQHALLAESVEPSALERVVRYLAHAAETLDEELQTRFGA